MASKKCRRSIYTEANLIALTKLQKKNEKERFKINKSRSVRLQ
jgi:hypothetical protein